MIGSGFEMEARPTQPIQTKHRCIRTSIPAPESFPLLREMVKYEPISNTGQPLIVWDHTEDGYKVCDPYGNKFIDFSCCVMIANSGHANPALLASVQKSIDKPLLASYLFPTQERVDAARELVGICPIPDAKVFMLSSGAEAVECAFKLARTYGQKKGGPKKRVVVSFEGAFHGRTLAAQALGGQPVLKDWLDGMNLEVFQAPWPNSYEHEWANPQSPGYDEDKMFRTLTDTIDAQGVEYKNIAGIMIESYYGSLCHPMPVGYAKRLREFCDRHDIILMMDEIQIGACRSGKWFGFEHYGILPDLFVAAKGLTGALPLSGVFGRRDIMDLYAPNTMTSTHSGSPLAAASTAANIRFMRENRLWEAAAEKGRIMEENLIALKKIFPHRIGYTGGMGMAHACTFAEAGTRIGHPEFALEVTKRCLEKGLLFFAAVGAGITMKLTPPLIIPEDALKEGLKAFGEAIAEADAVMPRYK